MPSISRLFRDGRAARGARRGHRRRQSSLVLRRRDAQGRRDGGAFACLQYRDLRRSASASGNRHALFRRDSVHGTTHRARAGHSRRSALHREGHARSAAAHRRAGQGGPGSAPRAAGRKRGFSDALAALDSALRSVCAALEALSERSEGLARCSERARNAQALLERWRDDSRADLVRWVEVFSHSLRLNATPLSIAEIFGRQLDGHPRGWIFTSATLAVAGDFSHYRGEMGLDEARTACWDSPFDYAAQALLYVPKKLPDPNSDEHTRAVVAASLPVIRAGGGRAFLLFTTLR